MPINAYECQKCGHRFEHLKIRSYDEPECPECGAPKEALEKEFPKGTSHQLKGAGWAKDNYGLKRGGNN